MASKSKGETLKNILFLFTINSSLNILAVILVNGFISETLQSYCNGLLKPRCEFSLTKKNDSLIDYSLKRIRSLNLVLIQPSCLIIIIFNFLQGRSVFGNWSPLRSSLTKTTWQPSWVSSNNSYVPWLQEYGTFFENYSFILLTAYLSLSRGSWTTSYKDDGNERAIH